jgi:hypothetical protein
MEIPAPLSLNRDRKFVRLPSAGRLNQRGRQGVPEERKSTVADPAKSRAKEREQVLQILRNGVIAANERMNAAHENFDATIREIPTSLQPDGVQRIHRASRDLRSARQELMEAYIKVEWVRELTASPRQPRKPVPPENGQVTCS